MSQKTYWWAWKIHKGRPIRRGFYLSESEAMREGRRDLGSDFEVVELPTRDRNVARDMIKDIILQRTGDLNFALRRFREKPLRSHP